MKKVIIYLLPALLIITASFNRIKRDEVVNYLNTNETLTINGQEYKLSWSSHPVSNYYKQEYIPVKEKPDRYKSMILLDYLLIDTPAKNIVGIKLQEISKRRETDKVANMMVQKNQQTGEYLLDFILSDGSGDALSVVELNAYRYKNYTDKAGHKGVLLFGLSKRAYDDDITPFMRNLKNERMDIIKTVAQGDFPVVEIK
jgi:hypothetical protein